MLYHALIFRLSTTSQKFYLYKMVLLVVRIQKEFETNLAIDQDDFLLPVTRRNDPRFYWAS